MSQSTRRRISEKPRHWIALLLAVVAVVLGALELFDFTARWEHLHPWTQLFLMLTLGTMILNMYLDRRAAEPPKTPD